MSTEWLQQSHPPTAGLSSRNAYLCSSFFIRSPGPLHKDLQSSLAELPGCTFMVQSGILPYLRSPQLHKNCSQLLQQYQLPWVARINHVGFHKGQPEIHTQWCLGQLHRVITAAGSPPHLHFMYNTTLCLDKHPNSKGMSMQKGCQAHVCCWEASKTEEDDPLENKIFSHFIQVKGLKITCKHQNHITKLTTY